MRRLPLVFLILAACGTPPEEDDPYSEWPRRENASASIETDWMARVRIPEHLERLGSENEAFVATACHALDSGDFASYASAASGLVALKEQVVPYLGHRGEAASPTDRLFRLVSVVLAPVFGEVEPAHVALHLDSPYRAVRAAAADAVGVRRLMEHAQALVGLLEDDRVEVRRAAIRSLRRLSNRYYGYNPNDPPASRAPAVERWRRLWGAR